MPYLSLTLADDYGRTTKRILQMGTQALLADYVTAAGAVVEDLEDVTDLALVRADLVIDAIVSGFSVTEGANVDVGATFSGFVEDGNGKKASTKVPGFKASLVDDDGTVPITGDTADYLANFEDGGYLMLSDGEQIETWIRGSLDR